MIICDNITKKYGKNTVLHGISFVLKEGEKAVIEGKSGIGKTTLLRLVAGLEKVDSGSLSGYSHKDVCYMFQEHRLLPWLDLLDNVTAPVGSEKREEATDLLSKLELFEHINKYPEELSGGMKQRAALARALLYNKPILLLDEPFSALDAQTKSVVCELIKKKMKDKTVILISHTSNDANLLFDEGYKKIIL